MPPRHNPYQMTSAEERAEDVLYIKMLQPQADADEGKLMVGEIVPLPSTKARRWVNFLKIAEMSDEDAYEDQKEEKAQLLQKRTNNLYNRQGQYVGMLGNPDATAADQVNANFGALMPEGSNVGPFDQSMLPRKQGTEFDNREDSGTTGMNLPPRKGSTTAAANAPKLTPRQLAKADADRKKAEAAEQSQTGAQGASGSTTGTKTPDPGTTFGGQAAAAGASDPDDEEFDK